MSYPLIKLSSRGAFSYHWNKCIDNENSCFVKAAKSLAGFFKGLFGGHTVSVADITAVLNNEKNNHQNSILSKEYDIKIKSGNIEMVNDPVSGKQNTKLDNFKKLITDQDFNNFEENFSIKKLKLLDAGDALLLFNSAIAKITIGKNALALRLLALRLLAETECEQQLASLSGIERKNALFFLAGCNCAPILEKLLSQDSAGINDQGTMENTLLMIAVLTNEAECIRVLLKYGADINVPNISGLKPIHYAANEKCLTLLLDAGANVNSTGTGGTEKTKPIYCAVMNGRIDCVKVLLGREGVDVNNLDNDSDETTLECAIRLGHKECAAALLNSPNIDLKRLSKSGDTLLSEALINGDVGCLNLLLEDHRIDLNEKNSDGMTPLFHAIKIGISAASLKVILCETRLELEERDSKGNTLLHHAVMWGNARTRLQATMSCEILGYFAIDSEKYRAIFNELLENDVISRQVDNVNNDGCTALHLATQAGNINAISALSGDV